MAAASSQEVERSWCGADADDPSTLAQDFVAAYYSLFTSKPSDLENVYAADARASRTWEVASSADKCTVALIGRTAIMQWIIDTIGGNPEPYDVPLARITICIVQDVILNDKSGIMIEIHGRMSLRREGVAVRRFEQSVLAYPANDGSGRLLVHNDIMHSSLISDAVDLTEEDGTGSDVRQDSEQRVDVEQDHMRLYDSTGVNDQSDVGGNVLDGCECANDDDRNEEVDDKDGDEPDNAEECLEHIADMADVEERVPACLGGPRSWAAIVAARSSERVDQNLRLRQDKGEGSKATGDRKGDGHKARCDGFVDKADAVNHTGEQHTGMVDSSTDKGDGQSDSSLGLKGKGGEHNNKGSGKHGKNNTGTNSYHSGGGEGYHGRSDDYSNNRKGDGHKCDDFKSDAYKGREGGGGYNGKGGRRGKGDRRGKPPSAD